ncbi:MAG TPA: protein kinase [Povalibacter sp.]|uniref:protein kinase domain-containing protein n=1 Tax=Povalibacter sp. TaxID=1962978 RepID=UPI002BA86FD9|nr:protein kinase [Povalibacter sp.]HMN46305.1 protein kinase [Povalibacter sp.]
MAEPQAPPFPSQSASCAAARAPATERIAADEAPTISPGNQTPVAADTRVIEVGTVLSRRYLIERAIGSGGMSTVFSALDRHRLHGPAADAKVAVKVLNRALLSDKARVERLIREFRYMQRLTHRGIVRVFDLDCDEGTWFITMELLQGEPLLLHLQQHSPPGLPADEALRLLTECTEALVCAHDHGVIHGDLKPGNIFVDAQGAARLLDFGSVPDKDEPADAARDRFLTPAYASPQMLEQQPADLRDDLFSLGCVAYELFTGQHPFGSKSSLEARDEGWRPIWQPSIPARHFGVIARMLSWEREQRPSNGREFLDSLTAAQVRASAAYSRPPRPAAPDPEPGAARRRSNGASHAHTRERKPTDTRREFRRTATPEELSRAFAQFAGKVPDDWVGTDEDAASPSPATTTAPPLSRPAAPDASARERWSRAIPPEWLEPKPRLEESAGANAPPAATIAESTNEENEAAPSPPRAVPWLSQLRWSNARVLNRVRRSRRTPAVPPALATASTAAATPSLRNEWIPQLHWRNEIALRWTDVQPAAAATLHQQVHIGTLPTAAAPVAGQPADAAAVASSDPPASAPPVRRVDWHKALATFSRASTRCREKLRAIAARERPRWRKEIRLLPHWRELRNSIGSLASPQPPRQRLPVAQWLTQRAPRWREAVPAMAIVAVGITAWGLLQVSDASRLVVTRSLERDHLAAQRLQALAEAPVDIAIPPLADLPLPSVPVERRAVVPAAAGLISFQSARIRVSAGQHMAVVNLRRNRSTDGSAPFAWRIAPGTAKPGVDYEQPAVQMARFNDGQDVRSLFIPITPAREGRPERRFTIKLMKTPGAPAFGNITETEVVIEGSG